MSRTRAADSVFAGHFLGTRGSIVARGEVAAMKQDPVLSQGSIVTYLCQDDGVERPFTRGVVCGPPIVDPATRAVWVPVRRMDRPTDLVAARMVIHASDPARGRWSLDNS